MKGSSSPQAPNPAAQQISSVLERIRNTEAIGQRIADEIVLPALARNFRQSGIKSHSGMLEAGITRRGAPGNYIRVANGHLVVGVDYAQIPYARWVLEWRGPVRARKAKALRFEINGVVFYRRSVKAAPAHSVYYLTDADLAAARRAVAFYVTGGAGAGL